jgi:hypothetical protein
MAPKPTIQRLSHDLVSLYALEGNNCERRGHRACYRTPEFRCEIGLTETEPGLYRSFSADLCRTHAKEFANTHGLKLPTSIPPRRRPERDSRLSA